MNETIRSHDRDAAAYVPSTAAMTGSVRVRIEDLAARLGPGDGWSTTGRSVADVSLHSGITGHRGESWLEVSAVRGSVAP